MISPWENGKDSPTIPCVGVAYDTRSLKGHRSTFGWTKSLKNIGITNPMATAFVDGEPKLPQWMNKRWSRIQRSFCNLVIYWGESKITRGLNGTKQRIDGIVRFCWGVLIRL